MFIQYLGHSCFLIQNGVDQVIIDPFLTGNPNAGMKAEEVKVKAVLVTHGHADHVGDAVSIAKRNDCPIVANYEISMYLAAEKGVKVEPMHIGGKRSFDWGHVKMTQAFHGSGIELGDGNFIYGGMPTGMIVTMNEISFYHAGDTGLFSDMKLIGELNHLDAAALPIGDTFTMGVEDSLIAASWLQADLVMPMHYNTFPPIIQDAGVWVQRLKQQGIRGVALQSGEAIEVFSKVRSK